MQFGFAGSPTFAADILQIILDAGLRPQLVITQTSKPTGRGQKHQHTPVYSLARNNNIPIATPNKIEECAIALDELDLLAVAAYGQILPETVLQAPRFGCINVHTSVLPRWRGASPIEHAILHGDDATGISIMHIEPKLDAGPVYLQETIALDGSETATTLAKTLAQLGGNTLGKMLQKFAQGDTPIPKPQAQVGITYAPRLTPEDARLDWARTATTNERKVRAFVGRTPAFTTRGDLRLRVLVADVHRGEFSAGRLYRTGNRLVIGCKQDGLLLETVQLNRGKGTPLSIDAMLNGFGRLFEDGIQFD